jgi:NAD(P)-dependent dehydrogenase (short-subunit alcohol dehydrogenase family)
VSLSYEPERERLADKDDPVTGANRGIGLGIAECCLVNGADKVFSIDLAEPGDEFAAMAKRFNGRLHAVKANVTKEESVTQAIDDIVAQAGALHGIVVNAGRTNHKAALDFTEDEIHALFDVNVRPVLAHASAYAPRLTSNQQLFGAFYCARVAARQFIKQGTRGAVVFTASMASYRPNKVRSTTPINAHSSEPPLTLSRSAYHPLLTERQKLASAI